MHGFHTSDLPDHTRGAWPYPCGLLLTLVLPQEDMEKLRRMMCYNRLGMPSSSPVCDCWLLRRCLHMLTGFLDVLFHVWGVQDQQRITCIDCFAPLQVMPKTSNVTCAAEPSLLTSCRRQWMEICTCLQQHIPSPLPSLA
jgi:hypothetical protein